MKWHNFTKPMSEMTRSERAEMVRQIQATARTPEAIAHSAKRRAQGRRY